MNTTTNHLTNIVIDTFHTKLSENSPLLLTSETKLSSLGMDSLKIVEILFELELTFDTSANEDLIAYVETIGDMARLFEHAHPKI